MARIGETYISKSSTTPYTIQFINRDLSQLNSDVIAIWKNTHIADDTSTELPNMKPDLYLHTTVLAGEKLGFWEKVKKLPVIDFSNVMFKSPNIDYLSDNIEKESEVKEWNIWSINGEWKTIHKNLYDGVSIFPGEVYPPFAVEFYVVNGEFPSESYIKSLEPGKDY